MNKPTTEAEIKKALSAFQEQDGDIKYPIEDRSDIEHLFYGLGEQELMLFFDVSLQGNNSGDWWLQCDFYSSNIKKSIVWDCDFKDYFESEAELIKTILDTDKETRVFEDRLPILEK